jgi:hypothetical protein
MFVYAEFNNKYKGDVTAKSYKYALECIFIPLAVYAWATLAACLARGTALISHPGHNLNSDTRRVEHQ